MRTAMQQQINLYPLLSKKSNFELTRRTALSVYGIVFLLLIIIYSIDFRQTKHLEIQYNALYSKVSQLQQELDKLPMSDAAALKDAIHALRQTAETKVNVLNSLTYRKNFSGYLLGLADTNIPGVWLTEIIFNNLEQRINLKGFALQTILIEKRLMELDKQAAFSPMKFEVQNVIEQPAPPHFEISANQET